MTTTILLKNGTVLQHQDGDRIEPLHATDVLIEGNRIKKIARDLQSPPDAQVINCSGRIVSPGMIDTHNHLWMTQRNARHAEQTLLEYIYTGRCSTFSKTRSAY